MGQEDTMQGLWATHTLSDQQPKAKWDALKHLKLCEIAMFGKLNWALAPFMRKAFLL